MFRALEQHFQLPRLVWIVLTVFLAFRAILILTYPPFNDESIHLSWARIMMENPEMRFISMIWGGKQPLPFWLFGIAESTLPNDPFIAGRLVSLLFSLLTMIGIYKVTKIVSNQTAAIVASLSFTVSPMAIFFGSQVLMESMVGAVIIWSLLLVYTIKKKPTIISAIILGIILGLGFWIKSTNGIVIGLSVLTLIFFIIRHHKQAKRLTISLVLTLLILSLILIPLITHPSYQALTSWNARYGMTIKELFQFPITMWWNNTVAGSIWLLVYGTPLFVLIAFLGIKTSRLLCIWSIVLFFSAVLLIKIPSSRYFFPALMPLFPLYGISTSELVKKKTGTYLFVSSLVLEGILSLILVFRPPTFFQLFKIVSPKINDAYLIAGWESGYGVPEAIAYLKAQSALSPIIILTRQDGGNPEDAMVTAFWNNPNAKVIQIPNLTGDQKSEFLEKTKAINIPIYFISRGPQYAGLKDNLKEVKQFTKPWGEEFVGVYRFSTNAL